MHPFLSLSLVSLLTTFQQANQSPSQGAVLIEES